ncbi:DUF1453 domain-containing protein [Pseudoxanthomonas wuyuanensis]|uniref:DUF1453 domain-containing protein n=1 Tax=Pseudoxanthomonas wuyuanensis TaxID=1073196 RepID=A0A286DB77_9GAMM|nr:DUF1453 domain-containing protein [Pseudoxanthomonas wuyuanensis]KAF1721855.1 DUF1453 domain-containing protein [Pseudoxanthomonas wuyuanensis]SOD55878.1 hypothetical protein SAMN06296416_10861 [Pseudoxanthomonas wuyuanensis]
MPLLLIPLLLLILLALWVVLLPLSLWQRYRYGKARRLARPWLVSVNAWVLALSVAIFVAVSAIGGYWWPGSLLHAAGGLALGSVLGLIGLWISRFEITPHGLYYQPDPWLVLALTAVVAGRIVLGFLQLYWHWQGADTAIAGLDGHGSLVGVAGLLLGYYLAYQWGLKRRLARWARHWR